MHQWLPGGIKRKVKRFGAGVAQRLREWTKPDVHGLMGGTVADATRSKSELMLENALLRQQLIVLKRQVKRPRLSGRERGMMVLLVSRLRGGKEALFIVQPDTVCWG